MFRALVIDRAGEELVTEIRMLDEAELPEGDTVVKVDYSTLNYKDGLAMLGKNKVIRSYPMVPGVDFAGTVESTTSSAVQPGDRVVLNGFEVGEKRFGGFATKARVPGDWLVKIPDAFTTRQAMAIGTAGFTAMLAVIALEKHGVVPESGDIVVTGAAGGVGSIAVAVLAKLGYRVIAATGRLQERDYLESLGAADLVDRHELATASKPLESARWAGAIDNVGSTTLAHILASTKANGTVAACGLAQGMDLPTTVAPFILRAVTLVGINSIFVAHERRVEAWERLARDLDPTVLESMTTSASLSVLPRMASTILAGKIRGRVVVDVNN